MRACARRLGHRLAEQLDRARDRARSGRGSSAAWSSCPRRWGRAGRSTRRGGSANESPRTTSARRSACAVPATQHHVERPLLARRRATRSLASRRTGRGPVRASIARRRVHAGPRRRAMPHAGDHALQLRQASVEEVAAAGKHGHRQLLRSRPREHVGERDDVVLLAVDHDRVGGRRSPRRSGRPRDRPAPCARACNALWPRASARRCRTRSRRGRAAASPTALARVGERGQRVVGLADAVVEDARGRADAAEVEAHRDVAEREERLRERLRRPCCRACRPATGLRMRDQRDAARGAGRARSTRPRAARRGRRS